MPTVSLSATRIQANRLDLLSRLAGDISHEIKNPLHAMVINLELVRRRVEKGEAEQALERVAVVEEEIRRVHALANALLESLRPARDAQTACGFFAVLDEIMPLVAARARPARVELETRIDPTALLVPMSAQDLRHVLLNVVDRAVRTVGAGSRFEIAASASAAEARFELHAEPPLLDDNERAWLGDAPSDAEHIDLDLRVVRHLVERAGGTVESAARRSAAPPLVIRVPAVGTA